MARAQLVQRSGGGQQGRVQRIEGRCEICGVSILCTQGIVVGRDGCSDFFGRERVRIRTRQIRKPYQGSRSHKFASKHQRRRIYFEMPLMPVESHWRRGARNKRFVERIFPTLVKCLAPHARPGLCRTAIRQQDGKWNTIIRDHERATSARGDIPEACANNSHCTR